jgi:hypothetical protein
MGKWGIPSKLQVAERKTGSDLEIMQIVGRGKDGG